MRGVVAVVSLAVVLLFAGTALAQTKVVVVPLGGKKAAGDAVAVEVLEGRTFSNKDQVGIDGAMVNNGAITFTPGSADQTVSEGYHDGSGTVTGDANLAPGNIKTGATIFGVPGTAIEASGTAAPAQVLSGQTFSNASGPASGSMPNIGAQNITPGATEQTITQGYHNGSGRVAGDGDLVSGNIKTGVTIFGVAGDQNVVDTSTGDAQAGDLRNGKKAWVDGSEMSGDMPTQTLNTTTTAVAAGYYDAADLAAVDTDLIAQNIACGTTIFGVIGTFTGIQNTVCSAGRVWKDRNLGASRVANSLTDTEGYGDLYQWGRLADGHQSRTSPFTSTISSTDVPGHGSFIRGFSPLYDWRNPQNNTLWLGVSGTNNPCPGGFRLPTAAEWETERASWSTNDAAGAFASPLKLVLAGLRGYLWGTLSNTGSGGLYWSSTVDGSNSRLLYFDSVSTSMSSNYRTDSLSVRCLQD